MNHLRLVLLVSTSAACQSQPRLYDIPVVGPGELAIQARRACEAAAATNKPVLLEFGAEWCSDCQTVARLRAAEPLATELRTWLSLFVNVGRFDRHVDLLERFEVEAIATWVVLTAPGDCDAPLEEWPLLRSRTVEPSEGDGVSLVAWLQSGRAAASSATANSAD